MCKDKLFELKSEIETKYNVKVYPCVADLSKPDGADVVYQYCKINNISIVNNAGVGGYGEFIKRESQNDIDMINLNVVSIVQLTHLFLQDFIKNKLGKILNVS